MRHTGRPPERGGQGGSAKPRPPRKGPSATLRGRSGPGGPHSQSGPEPSDPPSQSRSCQGAPTRLRRGREEARSQPSQQRSLPPPPEPEPITSGCSDAAPPRTRGDQEPAIPAAVSTPTPRARADHVRVLGRGFAADERGPGARHPSGGLYPHPPSQRRARWGESDAALPRPRGGWVPAPSKKMEAPGVEPGSRNVSSSASTGLVRPLSPRDPLRRTGSLVAKAEVFSLGGPTAQTPRASPDHLASPPPAPGGQTGERATV